MVVLHEWQILFCKSREAGLNSYERWATQLLYNRSFLTNSFSQKTISHLMDTLMESIFQMDMNIVQHLVFIMWICRAHILNLKPHVLSHTSRCFVSLSSKICTSLFQEHLALSLMQETPLQDLYELSLSEIFQHRSKNH